MLPLFFRLVEATSNNISSHQYHVNKIYNFFCFLFLFPVTALFNGCFLSLKEQHDPLLKTKHRKGSSNYINKVSSGVPALPAEEKGILPAPFLLPQVSLPGLQKNNECTFPVSLLFSLPSPGRLPVLHLFCVGVSAFYFSACQPPGF
jgi:hypothetical protein